MQNILDTLTEGTVFKNKLKESEALVGKWEKSGLLEGIEGSWDRSVMATLLENQAAELLRETQTIGAGDVQGFASVAFPLVRRVFAGLIANELVSVQPMSLPNGLVFFLDFKRPDNGDLSVGNTGDVVFPTGSSIYGDRLGQQIRQGVRIEGNDHAEKGFYNLATGYNKGRYHNSITASTFTGSAYTSINNVEIASLSVAQKAQLGYDVDLLQDTASYPRVTTMRVPLSALTYGSLIPEQDVFAVSVVTGSSNVSGINDYTGSSGPLGGGAKPIRRLNKIVDVAGTKYLELTFATTASSALANTFGTEFITLSYPIKDNLQNVADAGTLGVIAATSPWSLEQSTQLPEIHLKVDSFAITARTRKLKAAWTPEMAQDLNAYHNLDAEVELTSILSEQIGLDIDQEIVNDLIKGATAGTLYWSRRPGNFVNRRTGAPLATDSASAILPPDFTGNVSMWYETLIETINDVSALIHRKTLRGAANFLVTSPEVANILEMTAGFRASVSHADEKGSVGTVNVGSISKKWDVMVDPYFPRNVILVGRKGGSFLESGYVYAPYVPLQTTPTIFDPNNFTPRKAMMTRYGKTMVRPDMYGLVVCQDLLG
jgi:hypothetical protein